MENYFSSTFLSVKEQLHEDEEETKQAIFIWCMVILTQNIIKTEDSQMPFSQKLLLIWHQPRWQESFHYEFSNFVKNNLSFFNNNIWNVGLY